MGRSQGASIFWGVVSVFFAAAACTYYFKNHENEIAANVMRDEVMQLHEENESLASEKQHLQAGRAEAENELKTREDLVADKEQQLAQEEAQLEAIGQQANSQSPENLAQVPMIRRFNNAIQKLNKTSAADVVERNGRPVLRVPNSELFAPGDAALKPEGKALLNQITLAIGGQIENFELRVVSYTDTDAESDAATARGEAKPAGGAKPAYATSWDLTAARAATLGHYYRDQTTLPFKNVLVLGRGDSEPITSNTGPDRARNRRVEITITPLPVPFHPPEPEAAKPAPAAPAAAAPAKEKETAKPAAKTEAASAPKEKPAKKSNKASSP